MKTNFNASESLSLPVKKNPLAKICQWSKKLILISAIILLKLVKIFLVHYQLKVLLRVFMYLGKQYRTKCYKLEALVKVCMFMSQKARSSLEDVKALQALVLQSHIIFQRVGIRQINERLAPLLSLSNYMLRKIA